MNTIGKFCSLCNITPRGAVSFELGKFTLHCFRRGWAQHRFVTGKNRWILDVVKWWGGWWTGDDVNNILRYLLEETSKYETNYSHYLYTYGSDFRLFNSNCSNISDLSREIQSVQTCLHTRLAHLEKSTIAFSLFISEDLKKTFKEIKNHLIDMRKSILINEEQNAELEVNEDGIGVPTGVGNYITVAKIWRELTDQW